MKSGKFLLIIILNVSLTTIAVSQQISNELYQYNFFYINPAFAGMQGQNFSLMLNTRHYQNGSSIFEGSFSYDTKFKKINSGFGFIGSSATLGSISQNNLSLNYSYHVKLRELSSIKFGVRIENQRQSMDFSQYRPVDPVDPLLNTSGGAYSSNLSSSLGILVNVRDFYFGFSIDNLIRSNNQIPAISFYQEKPKPLNNLILGYDFKIGSWGKLMPSFYLPFDFDKVYKADLNSTLLINNKFITGVTLEINSQELIPKVNVGYRLNDFIQMTTVLYSKQRENTPDLKFRGTLAVQFYFN